MGMTLGQYYNHNYLETEKMAIGKQYQSKKIIKGVGGKAFPNDYNWICPVCGYENRRFELTCQACEHEADNKI